MFFFNVTFVLIKYVTSTERQDLLIRIILEISRHIDIKKKWVHKTALNQTPLLYVQKSISVYTYSLGHNVFGNLVRVFGI